MILFTSVVYVHEEIESMHANSWVVLATNASGNSGVDRSKTYCRGFTTPWGQIMRGYEDSFLNEFSKERRSFSSSQELVSYMPELFSGGRKSCLEEFQSMYRYLLPIFSTFNAKKDFHTFRRQKSLIVQAL